MALVSVQQGRVRQQGRHMAITHAARRGPARRSARIDQQGFVGDGLHGVNLRRVLRPRTLTGRHHRGTVGGQAGGIGNTSLGGPHHVFDC